MPSGFGILIENCLPPECGQDLKTRVNFFVEQVNSVMNKWERVNTNWMEICLIPDEHIDQILQFRKLNRASASGAEMNLRMRATSINISSFWSGRWIDALY